MNIRFRIMSLLKYLTKKHAKGDSHQLMLAIRRR